MEEQRTRVRSGKVAERFAAALVIPGVLRERLRGLTDFQIGRALDREVCSNLGLFAPELTVCMEAAERLCRRRAIAPAPPRRWQSLRNDGEHIMHAEVALYRARIPHLLLPFQRDKFASYTFMVPSVSEAKHSLCQMGFRETRSPSLLVDGETRQPIRVVEHR